MVYLVMFVVIAVIIGPIMWMMPSAGQRRLVELRQYAMNKGLAVKVVDLPQTHRQRVRKEACLRGVAYSLALLERPRGQNPFSYCLQRSEGSFQWFNDDESPAAELLAATLKALPDSIVAIEHASHGVSAYWQEKGDQEVVDRIYESLDVLRQELATLLGKSYE